MADDYETLLELARDWQGAARSAHTTVIRDWTIYQHPKAARVVQLHRARASAQARALYAGAEALRREREAEIADAHAHLDGFVRNKACKDCPIGGREGDGPVCPNVDKCDRECEELVQAGREMMGRKPGEACCDLWQDLLPEHHREQADG